jgi:flavin reductase (DIM6/NTAB) family NADH-FMN oxidoreductase RutF
LFILASQAMTEVSGVPLEDLRAAFRGIASNVAVITTEGPSGPHGCTATAWAEDPKSPYIVTALDRSGTTRSYIEQSGRFAASVLAADQADVARRFAKRGDRFAGLAYTLGPRKLALIDGAVLAVECQLERSADFGTYDLLVGRVETVTHRDSVPVLTWCDGFGTHVPLERDGA